MEESLYGRKYDVLVAGGGVSGAVSAISAGRMGAKVLVVEQNGYLGGTLTGCGVGPMMTFHAGEKQVIRGIMEEIVERLEKRGYSAGHVYDTMQFINYLTPFNAEGLKLVLDEMAEEAGCIILFHTFVGDVQREGSRIRSLTLCNKDGIHQVSASVYIDATGDGDVAAFAGAPMTKGREGDGAAQPMTMKMKYLNVDTDELKAYIRTHAEQFPYHVHNLELMDSVRCFSFRGFQDEFQEANKKGELEIKREDVLCFETNQKGEFIVNTTRILDHDATDALSLSEAERIGRRQCEQLDRFLHRVVPGFEHAVLEFTGPNIGVRGSRQLAGKYVLTAQDILERKMFDSVIVHSGYPIDIHNPDGTGTDCHFLEEGTYYSIPYEVTYTPEITNLLVAGRCVSATFEAQAAIRLTPTAGEIGHACGVAAVMAASTDGDVTAVDIKELQKYLREQNAYLDI